MTQAFLWTLALSLLLILLLESSSFSPKGSPLHRISTGGLILLVAGVVLATFRLMVVHQIPSFSLAPPAFFLTFPS